MTARVKRQTLSLRELTDEMLALDELSAMDDGEWTDEHQALADDLAQKLADKIDDFWEYRQTLRAQAATATEYAKQITAKAQRLTKRVAWLDGYVLQQMARSGRPFIQGEVWKVRQQANPPSVVLAVLPTALPEQYQRVIPAQVEADKVALQEALKRGETIPGVTLNHSYHLRAA